MSQVNNTDRSFDKRISMRNIQAGRISKNDFDTYVSSLPDLEGECEELTPEVYGSDRTRLAVTGEYSSSDDRDEDHL
ncbi:MAG: hypothetical protein KC505_07320 [Myxococcales bacterium]|nr:hypothetical protein [Myxococcales bacterium]USN50426.1 MAG: hypothetical protein H6731_09215 [Myxococcales bacterium]